MTAWAIAGVAGGVVTASAIGTTGFLSYLAHLLLVPDRSRIDDVLIHEISGDTVTLSVTPDTVAPGRYGLWFPGGHLRLGAVVDSSAQRVVRSVECVDWGTPRPGPARWNGWYYSRDPRADLGAPYENVEVLSDVGALPAWLIRPDDSIRPDDVRRAAGQVRSDAAARGDRLGSVWRSDAAGHADRRGSVGRPGRARAAGSNGRSGRWAVLIHGRGGERPECLRAVPVLRRCGVTSLIPSYRNDVGAPPSPDGRYNLGLSEWRDVEACVRYALAAGARDVLLLGWSMGGAAALQMLDRSPLAEAVTAVVLDSPVIDWGHVIRHQAAAYRVPRLAAVSVTHLVGQRWARRLVGVHQPLDVAKTNWELRAGELRHPMVLMHSEGDDMVPIGPSAALAAARPDLVVWERWTQARHTQLWNVDPDRWERAVTALLTDHA